MKRKVKIVVTLLLLLVCVCFNSSLEVCKAMSTWDIRGTECMAYLMLSGNIASSDVHIKADSSVDSMSIHVYLQRNTGNGWKTYASWNEKVDGNVADISKTTTVTSGADYRVRVFYYTYSDSGTGRYVEYSNEVSY